MLATLVSLPSAYGEKFQRNLVEGELDKYDLAGRGMGPGDNLKVDFTFAAQGMGDVYILTEVEYEYLKDNRPFNPSYVVERSRGDSFTWVQPDNGSYVLVVDNADNAHNNDAVPDGDLSFELEFEINPQDGSGIDWNQLVQILFIIISIIVALWIYKDGQMRGKRSIGLVILALILWPLALIIWLRSRPQLNDPQPAPSAQYHPSQPMLHQLGRQDHDPYAGPLSRGGYEPPRAATDRPTESSSPYLPRPTSDERSRSAYDHPASGSSEPAAELASRTWRDEGSVRSGPEMDRHRKCGECGMEVQADWKVCPGCTSPLEGEPTVPAGPYPCPDCGAQVQPDWKVCPRCTTELVKDGSVTIGPTTCSECGEEIRSDWKTCPVCETALP